MNLDPDLRRSNLLAFAEEVIGHTSLDELKARIIKQYNAGGSLTGSMRLNTPRELRRKLRGEGRWKINEALDELFSNDQEVEFVYIEASQSILLPTYQLQMKLRSPQSR